MKIVSKVMHHNKNHVLNIFKNNIKKVFEFNKSWEFISFCIRNYSQEKERISLSPFFLGHDYKNGKKNDGSSTGIYMYDFADFFRNYVNNHPEKNPFDIGFKYTIDRELKITKYEKIF